MDNKELETDLYLWAFRTERGSLISLNCSVLIQKSRGSYVWLSESFWRIGNDIPGTILGNYCPLKKGLLLL